MPWPTPQDYNEAVQNPQHSFCDPDLRSGALELTALGLPRPITGNFASVYRLRSQGRDWAVRCFWREFADMRERYEAISRHLRAAGLPHTVGFEYLPQGIKVRAEWYPALKMEWVEGQLLNDYIRCELANPGRLLALAHRWSEMIAALEDARIAHGDLQHGNVLVVDGQLKLVDYDGMFVPALAGKISHELGHQNYQHPGRAAADFGPDLDRFSSWVIYLSLLALGKEPELWDRVNTDESLLLRRRDFESPDTSSIVSLLDRHADPEIRSLAGQVRSLLEKSPSQLPSLRTTGSPATSQRGRRGIRVFRLAGPRERTVQLPARAVRPEWVQALGDSEAGITPREFRAAISAPRVLLVLAVGLSLLLWCIEIGGSGPAAGVLAAGAAAISCLASVPLVVSFRRDPAAIEKRVLQARLRRHARALALIRRSAAGCVRAEARLSNRFDRQNQRLARRRAQLEEAELCKLRAVRSIRERIAVSLHECRSALEERERQTLERALAQLQERHVQAALRKTSLRSATIEGVDWRLKLRLFWIGVRSAADVSSARAGALEKLDRAQVAPVLSWAATVRRQASRTKPSSLPPEDRAAVQHPYRASRAWLEEAAQTAERREQAICTEITSLYAHLFAGVDAAMRAAADAHERHLSEIRRRRAEECEDEPFHHRQVVQLRHDLESFARITLVRYALCVVFGRSA